MKVILEQDLKGKGKKGDLVNVNDGYARNYLIPKGIAVEATKSNIAVMESQKEAKNYKKAKELESAKKLAEKLEKITVTIKAKAGDTGKLFGSITGKDIAEQLKSQHKITVDKRKIELGEPINTLGNVNVQVRLYPEVTAVLNVIISKEE